MLGANFGGGSSKSSSSSQFNQNVMAQQIPALQQLWGNAASLWGNTNMQPFQQMVGGINNRTQGLLSQANPAFQQQLQGGINNFQLDNQLQNYLNSPSTTQQVYGNVLGGNSFMDPVINNLRNDMQIGLNRGGMRDQAAQAASRGTYGSGRSGTDRALLQADNDRNFMSMAGQLRAGNYHQDMNNRMKIAEQADSNKLNALRLGYDDLNRQNQTQQNAWQGANSLNNMNLGMLNPMMQQMLLPWQMMQSYSSILGDPQVLSSGSSSSKGSGFNMGGGFGGMF